VAIRAWSKQAASHRAAAYLHTAQRSTARRRGPRPAATVCLTRPYQERLVQSQ
jgi:hypothetical protein